MQGQEAFALRAAPRVLNLGQGSWQDYVSDDGRPYFVYIPANYQVGTTVPLVLMLHGCLESPQSFAYDAVMNQLADQHQFLVVYPQHATERRHWWDLSVLNPMLCWNFFYTANQYRGRGEPASLASIVQTVVGKTSHWTIDRQRIYVAGPSSGALMSVILGVTYPDLFAAIGVHSGGEYQWAQIPLPALPTAAGEEMPAQVALEAPSDAHLLFFEGFPTGLPPGPDPIEQGKRAYEAMGPYARVVPTMVFHGTADPFVNPINGDQVVQQWLCTNQLASHGTFTASFDHPSSVTPGQVQDVQDGHSYTVFTWKDAHGDDVIVYYKVDGMGHAWSGGPPNRPFADPRGPSASQAMYEFFMAHPHP